VKGFAKGLFRNKVVVVTGAGRGIGKGIAQKAAQLGASVAALEINTDNLAATAGQLREMGAEVLPLCGDVSDSAFLRSCITQIADRFERLDGWVNNAFFTANDSIREFDALGFTKAWEVNVRAAMEAAALSLKLFEQSGGGSIVNISSVLAHRTRANQAAYTSSKTALEGLTRALAYDLAASKIRVNCVIPGAIQTRPVQNPLNLVDTDLNSAKGIAMRSVHDLIHQENQPLKRIGKPEDVANAVAFLLSDLSAFITGITLPVDGGYLIDGTHLSEAETNRLAQECEHICNRLAAEMRE
jgi:NAD(P)-dependent dehydrogenase (short-subunit alcohol dehydrogenase family)